MSDRRGRGHAETVRVLADAVQSVGATLLLVGSVGTAYSVRRDALAGGHRQASGATA